ICRHGSYLENTRGCQASRTKSVRHSSPSLFFFFKQKTAYEIGLGIPAEPLFRSQETLTFSSASVRTSVFPARTRKVNANNSAALTGRSTPLIMFSVDRKSVV